MSKTFVLFICIFLEASHSFCQTDSLKTDSAFQQQDMMDWLANLSSKPPRPVKNSFLLLVPYISSNPTSGFNVGLGLTYTYKKSKTDQYLSVITGSVSYSTKKLANISLKSNMYVANGKLNLNGDWRLLINNNETTYGLGTDKFHNDGVDINGVPTEGGSAGQLLKYNLVRFYETASFKLFNIFFAGIGLHYDHYYNIIDDIFLSGDSARCIHHQHSKENGSNSEDYSIVGVSLNLLFDSRDNQVNAYKGHFVNVNYRINLTDFGSNQNSTVLLTELRSFLPLDRYKRHILRFWFYGNFVTSGKVPYLGLPALGYDQRQRTGRGYKLGQFRGDNLVYGETEYRFPISRNTGILGGDVFFNVTSTSDRKNGIWLLDYLRFGYGGGLRIMLDKQSRTRLAIDLGVSPGSVGFYFGAQETF